MIWIILMFEVVSVGYFGEWIIRTIPTIPEEESEIFVDVEL